MACRIWDIRMQMGEGLGGGGPDYNGMSHMRHGIAHGQCEAEGG